MIKECLNVYEQIKNQHGIRYILDQYIPADGMYILVGEDGLVSDRFEIKTDKKTREFDYGRTNATLFCEYDYYSRYLNSNKAVDPKKIVQSNNYMTFFIKKESLVNGKLTEGIIDGYFDILANPYKKHTKPKARQLYEAVEADIGSVDLETLEKNRTWIKEHIFEEVHEGKDYLKIFFETDKELYENESKRYFIPSLYNSNDYNVEVNGEIFGLPDNNLGMNAKKPYLENKTRKVSMPYMLSKEEALLQKELFDLLMTFAMRGNYNIFVDLEDNEIYGRKNGELPKSGFSGLFLRIQKGKTEAEIHDQEVIARYNSGIEPFLFRNVLEADFKKTEHLDEYKRYTNKAEIQALINDIFFNKMLINNYFTDAQSLSITEGYQKQSLLLARERMFNWIYKDMMDGADKVLDRVSKMLIIGSMENGYWQKAVRQYNLRISLQDYFKGDEGMSGTLVNRYSDLKVKVRADDVMDLESDQEYYFAVGQLVYYLLSLSKASSKNKNQSLATPFINAKSDKILKQKLKQYYKKYNHDILLNSNRFNNLYSMVSSYEYDGTVLQDDIIAGMLTRNVIYDKKQEDE